MDSEAILDEIAGAQGWSDASKIELLLRYVENQGSPDAFRDFLTQAPTTKTTARR